MPAASSGPYQSRIFNFVHQQSRRVSEQLGSTIRHLQVATSWGIQAILYPIYLLFQPTESAGKQFYSSQQNWRQLPEDEIDAQPQIPPATDQAIQRVLHLVKVLPLEVTANPSLESPEPFNLLASLASNALSRFKFFVFPPPHLPISPSSYLPISPPPHLPTAPPLPVQGIATQLSTSNLVLVTAQNEILDILNPQQQQKLQQRIIEEVANYWCRWMSWVQQDELTHSASVHLAPNKALAFLDQTVAGLESHHLAPISEVAITLAHRSWQPVLALAIRLTESLSSKTLINDTQQPVVLHGTERKFRIPALIWAAIHYFFGDRGQSQLGQTAPTLTVGGLPQNLVSTSDQLSDPSLQHTSLQSNWQPLQYRSHEPKDDGDSWLTLNDLFEQSTQLNPAPDWIESYATAMGYVKHPLEHLLQWLDHALLWLEELLMRCVQWVQQIAKKAV